MNMEAGAGMVSRLSVMVSSEAVVFKEAIHMLRGLPGEFSPVQKHGDFVQGFRVSLNEAAQTHGASSRFRV
jgi:hypothetical protein